MIRSVAAVAMLAVLVSAQAAADGVYVELGGGASYVADPDLASPGLDIEGSFETGFNIGGSLGYRFFDYFRAEARLDYRQSNLDKVENAAGELSVTGDLGIFSAMANFYIDALPKRMITPYVGAGFGVGVIDVDGDSPVTTIQLLQIDDDATKFAWNAMVGLSVKPTDYLVISAGYRYFATKGVTLDSSVPLVSVDLDVEADIGVHEFVAGVRYEF